MVKLFQVNSKLIIIIYNSTFNLFIIMKVTVPTSWEDITIKQFIELYNLKLLEQEPIEYIIDCISITCNIKYKDVCSFNLVELKKIYNKMEFINTPPTHDKLVHSYELDKVLYICNYEIQKISAGQYIDIKTFCADDSIKNIHNLMSVLYIPYGKKYNDVPISEVAEKFYNEMPITVAYPLTVFFCNLLESSMPDIKVYFDNQVKELLTRATKLVLEK